jgi:uncharacterized protein (DUF2147 family)
VQLHLGIGAKILLLLVVSVSLTMATYHFVVRRFAVTRFLFGMRARPRRDGGTARAMPRAAAVASMALVLGTLVAATPSAAASPIGTWLAEGGAATVEIAPCAGSDALCGRVTWLRSPLDEDGCVLRDAKNGDPTLRGRPVVGLEVLRDLAPGEAPDTWDGGTIYDPGSGNTYRCSAALDGADRLRLRGYVGIPILGRSTTWIRLGTEERLCAASVSPDRSVASASAAP